MSYFNGFLKSFFECKISQIDTKPRYFFPNPMGPRPCTKKDSDSPEVPVYQFIIETWHGESSQITSL